MKKYLPQRFTQTLFVITCLAVTAMNIIVLSEERRRILNFKKVMKHQIIGHQFNGLRETFPKVQYMGYYSCNDLKEKNDVKQFAHAQYKLAPTILVHNSTEYEYTFFACEDEAAAWKVIRDIRARPLKRNKYKMILTQKR